MASVTEQARRKQIVDAAVAVIAAEGYAKASFGRIAKQAGLSSTGLISYHFANKRELMEEVVRAVLAEFTEFVLTRTDTAEGPAAQLRAFITANVEFAGTHRTHLLAMLDVARAEPGEGPDPLLEADLRGLAELLREGQRLGEFREFDPVVMAVAIRSARDGLLLRLRAEPELDLAIYAEELGTLFDLATRRTR
ncbi:TetR/AcrR family transcriptional regulator [Amycolatopsis sp. 195334CR]|uniref:TetR/AcrR family transcriptional regulator n=1 Tax=Amycolatopsis sp. 195334CR TaxID=2814588 RepID=UPI001A90A6DC|nr:TetR/AcrR family transcriptional regulator [Amycolatopsis sp. 195334CR]MBN6036908.1 TetR family transcriptional regulator [Amycolatopsis sp. 195334CR]